MEIISMQYERKSMLENFIINYKKDGSSRRSKKYYKKRLEMFQEQWNEFHKNHLELLEIRQTEKLKGKTITSEYFTDNVYSNTEMFFIDNYSMIEERFEQEFPPQVINEEIPVISNKNHGDCGLKLPKIVLEKFSGDYKGWPTFHDMFKTLVHNNEQISAVQKLQYLKAHIIGEPEQLLRHFQVTEKNYFPAWKLLIDRYDNKRILINSQLNRLLFQNTINFESSQGIKCLLDTTNECLLALKNLEINTEGWDPIVVFLLVQKLPQESHRLWEQEVSKSRELASWKNLKEFLESRFRTLEAIASKRSINQNFNKIPNNQIRPKVNNSFHITSNNQVINQCLLCQGPHIIRKCERFLSMSPIKRSEIVREKRLCLNCLLSGHMVSQCSSKHTCYHCKKRHHTLIHLKTENAVQNPQSHQNVASTSSQNHNDIQTYRTHVLKIDSPVFTPKSKNNYRIEIDSFMHNKTSDNQILLATALVRIVSLSGNEIIARALIDQGSQASFITEKIVQNLQLKKEYVHASVRGIGEEQIQQINSKINCTIKPLTGEHISIPLQGFVMKKLTNFLPSSTIKIQNWQHLDQLELADPKFYEPGHVDLLLGAEIFCQIIIDGLIKGEKGMPIAQNTIFGWILSGTINNKEFDQEPYTVNNFHISMSLENQLKAFWEIEEMSVGNKLNDEESKCEEIYEKTTTRLDNGKYEVHLPFCEMNSNKYLGSSRDIALRRLFQLESRFKTNEKFKEEYVKCINEYLSLGHMIPTTSRELLNDYNSIENKNYASCYLPHHGVVKETSTTTKLRVVFDASRPTKSGFSLNDMMLKGPTVQDELASLLIRWRKHRIAFTADIEKMYRQIWVNNSFTEFQRIVWRDSVDKPIQDYKLLTVTFGTKSAPYLATRTINKIANDDIIKYPIGAKIALSDFYVDDLLSGADKLEMALEIKTQITTLLEKGGFPLRKWSSNSEAILDKRNDIEIEKRLPIINDQENVRALGINWNTNRDTLTYSVNFDHSITTWSKRTILSKIAQLFDPLGWVSPVIVMAKMILQKLWLSGIGWDDKVSDEINSEWKKYYQHTSEITNIEIARWMHFSNTTNTVEIHGFADASTKAYAAVVYMCTINSKGVRNVSLIASKTKVAPIKTISLPRLELCAAHLTAKLIKYVMQALKITETTIEVHAWTDSEIVLAWLKAHPSKWNTFVANRVSNIHELLETNIWNHVPTKQNPADCASRGMYPAELQKHQLWWHGPDWLKKSKEYWPYKQNKETDLESRKICLQVTYSTEYPFESKFSKFTKLLRVTAYCIRFIANSRKKNSIKINGYLKNFELQKACTILVKRSQERNFKEEISNLMKQRSLSNKSKIMNLNPFLDSDNILRVGGRLKNASLSYEEKHPIILYDKDNLTQLLIEKIHLETLHGGFQLMMVIIKKRYWIVNARNTIRSHIHKCIICFKQKTNLRTQLMGDLPIPRVRMSRPFAHSGLDYCGPFELKTHKGRGAKKYKAYISLFICMAVKAIHLELVTDLTAEGFIAAFRRFCSRRGLCKDLYCDCGTNFVGANKILSKQHTIMMHNVNIEIAESLENIGVHFHFNPPSAPHFGGLWEAGVRSTKFHLKRVIGNNILTYEEFSTVLCQIEACLNSRPLSELTNDPQDLNPLTPAHFLIGDTMLTPPQESVLDINIHRLSRWQHLQHITQSFWRRWNVEYLSRLQQRPKWMQKSENVKIGDLVLIKNDNLPPCQWSLGRIIILHPGSDDLVRVVTLKTKNAILKRPVAKICVLPIAQE